MFCGRLVCHTEPFATEPALTTTVGLQPYSNGWARMVGLLGSMPYGTVANGPAYLTSAGLKRVGAYGRVAVRLWFGHFG